MKAVTLTGEAAKRVVDEIEAKGRDVEEFVNTAVLRELSRDAKELEEIRKGLAEADAGDFATEDEVQSLFRRYDLNEKG